MKARLKVASISIAVNVLLVGIKVVLAAITGSVALLADAYHSASDIGVSLLVMLSLVITKKKERPGAYVEGAVSLVIAFLIFGAALGIFIKAKDLRQSDIRNIPIALGGIFICIIISHAISAYKVREGTRLSSLSLRADGFHSRMDMLSSIAVMVVLFGQMIGIPLDRLAAIVICLLIAWVGVEVLLNAFKRITGEGPVEIETVGQILRSGTLLEKTAAAGEMTTVMRLILYSGGIFLGFILFLKRNIRKLGAAAAAVIILLYAVSGIYRIQPDERGVILRFGKPVRIDIPPGPGYRWPWPFERLLKVRRDVVRRTEVGFRTKADVGTMPVEKEYLWEATHISGLYTKKPDEALMLTGDTNIIDINLVVQYRIKDMGQFLFNITRPDALVRNMAEASIREIIGQERIDDVLTRDRRVIESKLVDSLQKRLEGVASGIEVEAVMLQDVHPPVEVVAAFREVASAKEDKQTFINEAYGYRSEQLPKARGESEKMILNAKAYSTEKVDMAHGDAARFLERLGKYKGSERITELRMYLETMEKVLPGVNKYIVNPRSVSSKHDIWFFGPGRKIYYPGAEEY